MTDIHVMLDLETASTESNAAIISIGAHAFHGRLHHTDQFFHEKNSIASAESLGLHISKETMEWWNAPERFQARAAAFSGQEDLQTVLAEFHAWCYNVSGGSLSDIHLWGNGADFDLVILRSAYETHTSYPFNFRNHRCYRTVNALFGHLIPGPKYAERQHDALADAKHQASRISHLVEKGIIVL